MSGSGIRPRWGRLFERGNRATVDFSVSPVHEIVDDVGTTPPTVLDGVVTGITAEFAVSEFVTDSLGDIITAGV